MAFATLRFAGDALDPRDISDILPEHPWRAHRKGERFNAGKRAGELTGRTGIWYLSTDTLVDSPNLADHLRFLKRLLYPAPGDNFRLMKIRDVLGRTGARARISVFWRGPTGARPPSIPGDFVKFAHEIGADIEPDFETDDEDGGVRA